MAEIYRTPAGGDAVRARYAALLGRWPVPSEHRRVATSEGETFVVAFGPEDAPAVLLLHGSSANSASWMGDAQILAERFRVYAVDMIGEPGFSAPSRPPLASHVYAAWLDEVRAALRIEQMALVGISLGGWLALEYATHHPERVSALALLCPGGVGRHRNVLLWALPLLLLGPWGRRKILQRMGGSAGPPDAIPATARAFGDFMDLIFANFRPRTEVLPPFDDARLRQLTMPVLAVLGAKDVMIDSGGTRDRLVRNVPNAEIVWLPEAGHILVGQGGTLGAFLARALFA